VKNACWILVVDDDRDIRDVVVLLLGLEGYEVVGACDGLDALGQIRERGRPGAVLLDLRMPRMSGADFVRALRRDPALAATPIIVVSGDTTATDVAASIGAMKCLIKPLGLAELLDALSGVMSAAEHRLAE
jgi:CheY-like chemotaxis protein